MVFKGLTFRRKVYDNELTLEDALEEQIKFKNKVVKFKESAKPKTLGKKEKKRLVLKTQIKFLKKDNNFLITLKVYTT